MSDDETLPVADALDGVPTPLDHTHMVGHNEARQAFSRALADDRLHHAWLLAGPRGIGKATLALRLAAQVLAGTPDLPPPEHAIHSQMRRGGHPNLLYLSRTWDQKNKRFRTQLVVDDVRRINGLFAMTAGQGRRRVCIVDAADDMNPSAANAILKTLEEPPRDALFLLVSHSPGRLLPTIRSRCRVLPMHPLGDAEVGTVVDHLGLGTNQKDLAAAVRLSEGSPRRAAQILNGNVLKAYAQFRAAAEAERPDWAAVHALADLVTAKRDAADEALFYDLVFGWLGERVRAGGPPAALARWADVWNKARETLDRAETFNLDRRQVLLDVFASLFEANAALEH